jgi:septum formation topological specificity factor MinE
MSRTRRTFGKRLQRVVLEALKKDTIEVLAKVRAVAQSNFNVEVRSDTESFCSFSAEKRSLPKMKFQRNSTLESVS